MELLHRAKVFVSVSFIVFKHFEKVYSFIISIDYTIRVYVTEFFLNRWTILNECFVWVWVVLLCGLDSQISSPDSAAVAVEEQENICRIR